MTTESEQREAQLQAYRDYYSAGMRAMSPEEMEQYAQRQAYGMSQYVPTAQDQMRYAAQSMNLWPPAMEPLEIPPTPTRWQRFRAWLSSLRVQPYKGKA